MCLLSVRPRCFLWLQEQLTRRKSGGRGRMCAIDHAGLSSTVSPRFGPLPFNVPRPLIFDSARLPSGRSGPREVSLALSSWLRGGNSRPAPLSFTPQSLIDGCVSQSMENPGQTFFHISNPSRRIAMDICSSLPTNHHGREKRSQENGVHRGCNCPPVQRRYQRGFRMRAKTRLVH